MTVLPNGMVGGLTEIAVRVRDLDAMEAFYRDVLGLQPWRRFGDEIVFFKSAETVAGRPQALALFVESWPSNLGESWAGLDAARSTMHHFALSIGLPDLRRAAALLDAAGVATVERTFAWVGWRSLMLRDPEGNVVELVANDPSVLAPTMS